MRDEHETGKGGSQEAATGIGRVEGADVAGERTAFADAETRDDGETGAGQQGGGGARRAE